MAHHKAAHSHDIDMQKEFQVRRPERVASGNNPNILKQQSNQGESDKAEQSVQKESHRFEIAGFPWLFVFNMGVIALGVLGMVLKLFGVF